MADPTKPSKAAGSYAVGYKKPPTEHQFKSKQLGDSPIKRARKESVQDIARLFDKPVPVVNQIRTYWWCSPPRTGRQRMLPARSTARETGASFSKDRCVRTSL